MALNARLSGILYFVEIHSLFSSNLTSRCSSIAMVFFNELIVMDTLLSLISSFALGFRRLRNPKIDFEALALLKYVNKLLFFKYYPVFHYIA